LELKVLTDKIQEATDAMRKIGEESKVEAQKLGTATAETKAAWEKSNRRIDELELELKRMAIVSSQPIEKGAMSPEKKMHIDAFCKWLRLPHGKMDMEPQERKALVEDASGLILVPEDLEAEITRSLPALTPMRGICRQRSTTRDKIRRRSLTEVSVGWGKLETGTPITESTMVPSEDDIYVEDLYGLTKIGEDELMDTDVNLQQIIADSFRIAIATAENTAFVVGTGHALKQPSGVVADATFLAGGLLGGAAGAEGTYGWNLITADTIVPDDLLKIEYKLPAQYLAGASWLMHRKTELAVRLVKAAVTGTYLWQPSLQIGQPNQFDGFPIVNSSDMNYPADTLDQKIAVMFGNFRMGYCILDRMGISLQRLDELYSEAGLVGFKVHFRVGGGILRYDTFTVLSNEST
jgi:HK97 family phage major capsid protein